MEKCGRYWFTGKDLEETEGWKKNSIKDYLISIEGITEIRGTDKSIEHTKIEDKIFQICRKNLMAWRKLSSKYVYFSPRVGS